MLIFSLKKEWYEKIKSGEKTVEYREVKPYWSKRINKEIASKLRPMTKVGEAHIFCKHYIEHPCLLRLGYTKQYMKAFISEIAIVNGKDTDLAIDKPVYAIHLVNVKEIK